MCEHTFADKQNRTTKEEKKNFLVGDFFKLKPMKLSESERLHYIAKGYVVIPCTDQLSSR